MAKSEWDKRVSKKYGEAKIKFHLRSDYYDIDPTSDKALCGKDWDPLIQGFQFCTLAEFALKEAQNGKTCGVCTRAKNKRQRAQ